MLARFQQLFAAGYAAGKQGVNHLEHVGLMVGAAVLLQLLPVRVEHAGVLHPGLLHV